MDTGLASNADNGMNLAGSMIDSRMTGNGKGAIKSIGINPDKEV